ncbi:MAG: hypothetical protein ACRD4X_18530 [Candidatus Acidiferrales bacterium]
MKKATISNAIAVLSLLAGGLAGCAAKKTAVNPPRNPPSQQDWTITATWQENFTNFIPCSSTVTKGCVSGFTWGYLQGTSQVSLKTSAPGVCTGTTQPETCTDTVNATLGIGPVTFFCVANYIDNAGNTGNTAADQSAQQVVNLASPSSLAVVWQ